MELLGVVEIRQTNGEEKAKYPKKEVVRN